MHLPVKALILPAAALMIAFAPAVQAVSLASPALLTLSKQTHTSHRAKTVEVEEIGGQSAQRQPVPSSSPACPRLGKPKPAFGYEALIFLSKQPSMWFTLRPNMP